MIFFDLIFFLFSWVKSFADSFGKLSKILIIFEDGITIFDLMIGALTFYILIQEEIPYK